ncbi:hypothetical protein ACJ73_07984, partial [Blastomyces percursus]
MTTRAASRKVRAPTTIVSDSAQMPLPQTPEIPAPPAPGAVMQTMLEALIKKVEMLHAYNTKLHEDSTQLKEDNKQLQATCSAISVTVAELKEKVTELEAKLQGQSQEQPSAASQPAASREQLHRDQTYAG